MPKLSHLDVPVPCESGETSPSVRRGTPFAQMSRTHRKNRDVCATRPVGSKIRQNGSKQIEIEKSHFDPLLSIIQAVRALSPEFYWTVLVPNS